MKQHKVKQETFFRRLPISDDNGQLYLKLKEYDKSRNNSIDKQTINSKPQDRILP